MSRPTPETDAELHGINAVCKEDRKLDAMTSHARKLERERDEALEKIKQQKLEIVRLNGATSHAGGTPLKIALRERDEWKNKAYSHATDYTLMEAKCFRLEQQLKEYDKLKS